MAAQQVPTDRRPTGAGPAGQPQVLVPVPDPAAAGSAAQAPKRLTRDQHKAQTRTRLLEAAGTVFARRGFEAASLEEVAEEAGYSKGAVYSNFTGKEDLFATLLEQRCHGQLAQIEAALCAEPLTAARLRAIGDTLGAGIQHDREWTLLFVEFWARAVRNPELGRRFVAIWQQARTGLAELIARHATQQGIVLPVAPDQLAAAAMALANGLALQLLADPQRVPPQTLGNALALLFAGLHAAGDQQAGGAPAPREQPPNGSSHISVQRTKPRGGVEMAFDPICGMEVDQDRWSLRYADTTYWFCSPACRDEFQRAPRMLVALGPKLATHPDPIDLERLRTGLR